MSAAHRSLGAADQRDLTTSEVEDHAGPPAGPRLLLQRLRQAMAEPISAQARLDKIVTLIAANMVAEVCSLYVLHADGVLELYATEGLKSEAVHSASLRVGQGLVGTIAADARPLNLPSAKTHPAYQYLPETGEERFTPSSACRCCVPGKHWACWWCRTPPRRNYHDEEVEALQTTAMVLAEIVGLVNSPASAGAEARLMSGGRLSWKDFVSAKALAWATPFCTSRAWW